MNSGLRIFCLFLEGEMKRIIRQYFHYYLSAETSTLPGEGYFRGFLVGTIITWISVVIGNFFSMG